MYELAANASYGPSGQSPDASRMRGRAVGPTVHWPLACNPKGKNHNQNGRLAGSLQLPARTEAMATPKPHPKGESPYPQRPAASPADGGCVSGGLRKATVTLANGYVSSGLRLAAFAFKRFVTNGLPFAAGRWPFAFTA
jgi:hypothetical protein